MPFDWNKAAESRGGEPIPDGIHRVSIPRVRTGWKSKKQEDQIVVTFQNDDGQIDAFYTLSDAAVWSLARLLSKVGIDLKKMEADGIEPKHLSKQEVADQYLLNSSCWIKVHTLPRDNPKNLDKNGEPYRRVEPLTEEEAEKVDPAAVAAIRATFDSEIPF